MPYILLILLLPFSALAADPEKLDRELAKLSAELGTLRQEAIALESDLSTLNNTEEKLRSNLARDVKQLDRTVRDFVRLERSPKAALWAVDLLNVQTKRNQVVVHSQASLAERIIESESDLTALFNTRRERWETMQKLKKQHSQLARKQRSLLAQQEKALAAAQLDATTKSKLQSRARRWQKNGDLSVVFDDLVAASAGYIPTTQFAAQLPATGTIQTAFNQKDANGLLSQGLVIATTPGAKVIAPQSGRIIYNGPFRGYGQLVILEHPDNYHSVFSGLALDRRHQVGDMIATGDPIGHAPANPNPQIYFELRQNGSPINPKTWLAAASDG